MEVSYEGKANGISKSDFFNQIIQTVWNSPLRCVYDVSGKLLRGPNTDHLTVM